jgi:hypothetical protein
MSGIDDTDGEAVTEPIPRRKPTGSGTTSDREADTTTTTPAPTTPATATPATATPATATPATATPATATPARIPKLNGAAVTTAGLAGEVSVRRPGARRARRRGVGSLIGEGLAAELLESHPADVLLSDRCSCGESYPCRSRRFAATFVTDDAYLPVERAVVNRIAAAAPDRRPVPRHADPGPATAESGGKSRAGRRSAGRTTAEQGTDPAENSEAKATKGRTADGGRRAQPKRADAEAKSKPAEDLDATQQIPKIQDDHPPVAVAV